jgi:hypothetical protein
MQKVGIDVGRYNVKYATPLKQGCFRNEISEYRKLKVSKPKDYIVTIDNQTYFVGKAAIEGHLRRTMATANKNNEETKILCYTALALAIGPGNVEIITNIPVEQHTDIEKQQLIDLLKGQHEIYVKFADGTQKGGWYDIRSVKVTPEGFNAYADFIYNWYGHIIDEELATRPVVRGIDWASRMINYYTMVFDPDTGELERLDRESGSLDYGYYQLLNSSKTPSEQEMKDFVAQVVGDIATKWLTYDADEDVILHSGGGVKTLKQYIENHFIVNKFSERPLEAGAAGNYKLGVAASLG